MNISNRKTNIPIILPSFNIIVKKETNLEYDKNSVDITY